MVAGSNFMYLVEYLMNRISIKMYLCYIPTIKTMIPLGFWMTK